MEHKPKHMVTIRVKKELLEKIDKAADEQHRSRTDFIIQAVLKELNDAQNK